jgi:hypothetical protein
MNLDRFARLLGLQRTSDMRDRLHAVRTKYALHEDDPVWDLVAAVEEFCANLISEFHVELARLTSPSSDIPSEPQHAMRSPHLWRVAVLCGAAAAAQTLCLAASFYLGTRAASDHIFTGALGAPVGAIAFVLATPLLAAIVYLGWRTRRAEPAVGWSLMLAGAGLLGALGAALWWLL